MGKLFFTFLVLIATLIVSCKQKANPLTEYGDTLINSYERSKKAGAEANLKSIQNAINVYHATNGEYPKALKDIEGIIGAPINSELYQYNPENGEIKLKNK